MNLQRLVSQAGGFNLSDLSGSTTVIDNAESINISSLALLKMLKHGRAGVPMEVMGLMLGDFVDEYTVNVTDVFAMPQNGTGVSVEAVDEVFQTRMMEMLQQTGRDQVVVGWYHSHPGFGCWLSNVDVSTQKAFERLNSRAVAVVVDPIQSVKGKVVIDAFRLISQSVIMLGQEPRQTTSNLGYLNKPSIQALIHGLNRHYYSMNIKFNKTSAEEQMLLNVHKDNWSSGLQIRAFGEQEKCNEEAVAQLVKLASQYTQRVAEEKTLSEQELKTRYVGRQDPKKHLEDTVNERLEENIVSLLATNVDRVGFQ